MATQTLIDCSASVGDKDNPSNVTHDIAISDNDLATLKPMHLTLTWDGGTNTLSAQVQTTLLSGATRNDVSVARDWLLQIGDIEYTITTDANGAWSDTVSFADSNAYSVTLIHEVFTSDTIQIQDGV